jgi:hypothetical protein
MWRRRAAIRRALLAELVYREINEAGCATSSALMERMRVTYNELFYALDRLRKEGRIEAVSLGRAAFWCINSAAAEAVLAKLTEALKSLLCRRSRFVTPKEALQLVAEDKEMRKLFSRHMTLRLNPATIQLIDVLMMRAFEKPIKTSRSRIYITQCL